jgi:hypothetical protein
LANPGAIMAEATSWPINPTAPVLAVPVSPAVQRVYGPQDHETAFHVWHGPAGRSLNRTAALTGYPLTTVHRWSHDQGWHQRSDDLRNDRNLTAAISADAIVQQLIIAGQVPSIVALHETIANPAHRDRVDAALAMLALGGRPLPKPGSVTQTRTMPDGSTLTLRASQLLASTPDQLAALVAARLSGDPLSLPDPEDPS